MLDNDLDVVVFYDKTIIENLQKLVPSDTNAELRALSDVELYAATACSHPGRKNAAGYIGNESKARLSAPAYLRVEQANMAYRFVDARDGSGKERQALDNPVAVSLLTCVGINFREMQRKMKAKNPDANYDNYLLEILKIPERKQLITQTLSAMYLNVLNAALQDGKTDVVLCELSTGYFSGAKRGDADGKRVHTTISQMCGQAMLDASGEFRQAHHGAAGLPHVHVAGKNRVIERLIKENAQAKINYPKLFSGDLVQSLTSQARQPTIAVQLAGADNSAFGGLSSALVELYESGKVPRTQEESTRLLCAESERIAFACREPKHYQLYDGTPLDESSISARILEVAEDVKDHVQTQAKDNALPYRQRWELVAPSACASSGAPTESIGVASSPAHKPNFFSSISIFLVTAFQRLALIFNAFLKKIAQIAAKCWSHSPATASLRNQPLNDTTGELVVSESSCTREPDSSHTSTGTDSGNKTTTVAGRKKATRVEPGVSRCDAAFFHRDDARPSDSPAAKAAPRSSAVPNKR